MVKMTFIKACLIMPFLLPVNIFIQWLENDFLGYLNSWETSVKQRKGFSAKQKKMMLMPEET